MSERRQLLPEKSPPRSFRTVDPLFTLQVPPDTAGSRSSVAAVCFLPINQSDNRFGDEETSGRDTSDDEEPIFRCRTRIIAEQNSHDDTLANARNVSASLSLSGSFLASSHASGDSFLWDLGRRRIVSEFCKARGAGIALRRLGNGNILYHTRDNRGTVSIHNIDSSSPGARSSMLPSCPVVAEFQTNSRTFCAASPCAGNAHLVALPSEDECCVTVRDLRVSSTCSPVAQFQATGQPQKYGNKREHGMLTALAMSEAFVSSTSRPVVACGMESGSVFFHDMGMSGRPLGRTETLCDTERDHLSVQMRGCCSMKLGNNPVLGLDMAPSSLPSSTSGEAGSVLAIAGMAGDAADILDLPESERGTVAVLKAVFPIEQSEKIPTARLRARLPTCRVGDDTTIAGKPGVAACRFRPDGRIFAIGGWDKRLRIFDRTGNASPLAILKAHTESVTAVDWAPVSGMLATGAGDGRICFWQCFPLKANPSSNSVV